MCDNHAMPVFYRDVTVRIQKKKIELPETLYGMTGNGSGSPQPYRFSQKELTFGKKGIIAFFLYRRHFIVKEQVIWIY